MSFSLPETLTNEALEQAQVYPISFDESSKEVTVAKDSILAPEVIKKHKGKFGTVCFVVRRPG